jgi:hypothetical protein
MPGPPAWLPDGIPVANSIHQETLEINKNFAGRFKQYVWDSGLSARGYFPASGTSEASRESLEAGPRREDAEPGTQVLDVTLM